MRNYDRTQNFNSYSQSYTVSATASNQNTVVTQPTGASVTSIQQSAGSGAGYTDLIVYNGGTTMAFLNWGMTAAAAVATTTSPCFVPPGAIMVFSMGQPYTNVGIILASSTGSITFAVGEGA